MAKQILKVTDFTGGVNSYSDPRDIQDNQFAQNWNAALDKTGIVRYSGGGIKSIANLPQDNTNQINGFGLFRFTTDYTINSLDSDLNAGIERGTIAAVNSSTTATLEATDTLVVSDNTDNDNYYTNMSILIYAGTGAGQTRQITGGTPSYDASTRIITHPAFGTGLGTDSKYIIIPWGTDGSIFGNGSNINWITDGASTGYPSAVESPNGEENNDFYFLSKTADAGIGDESHESLGYIQYKKSLTLKQGVNYTLSFDCRATRRWFNYVSNGESDGSVIKSDQVPWVYLSSTNANLGLHSDGEVAKFIDTSGSPSYSGLQANYIDNGDFASAHVDTGINVNEGSGESVSTSSVTVTVDGTAATTGNSVNKIFFDAASGNYIGNCTARNSDTEIVFGGGISHALVDDDDLFTMVGWNEIDANGYLTVGVDGSSTSYGTQDGTAILQSIEGFNFDSEPSSYIFSDDMTLVEDTPHHLNFLYASTDGVAYAIYDVTNSAYVIDWTVLPPTETSSTYRYANEELDETSNYGKKQTRYISFTSPSNNSDSLTTLQVRFAPVKAGSTARFAGVVLRKGVCDLNTMSYNGSGANPFLDDRITQWNTYSFKFKLNDEEYPTEQSDWDFRIFGGLATHRANATGSENTQTVYIGNIRLIAEEPDTITLLNDNQSSASYITMYSESKSNWDTKFIRWEGLKCEPTYSYVNGMLKISDGNFNNENRNVLMYRQDRMFLNKYFNYGWNVQKYSIPNAPNTIITATTEDGIFGTSFDAIPHINKVYANLEFKNANRPENATYTNLHQTTNTMSVTVGQTEAGVPWADGRWTNWDMDDIKNGVLLRHGYKNRHSGSILDNESQQEPGAITNGQFGCKDSELDELEDLVDRTATGSVTYTANSQKHAMYRGIKARGNISTESKIGTTGGEEATDWGHNPISFWIPGVDAINTENDMSTVVGANKIISSIDVQFVNEFQTGRYAGSSGNAKNVSNSPIHYFKVEIWKVNNDEGDIAVGATTLVDEYNGVNDQEIKYEQLAADTISPKTYFPVATKNGEELLKTFTIGKGDYEAGRSYDSNGLLELDIVLSENVVPDTNMIRYQIRAQGQATFKQEDNITSNDNIFITIREVWANKSRYSKSFAYKSENAFHWTGTTDGMPNISYSWEENSARYSKIKMEKIDVNFFGTSFDENTSNEQSLSDNVCQVNFNYASPTGVDAAGWGENIFKLATSSVNIYNEESGLNENDADDVGSDASGSGTIALGHSPTITLYMSNTILRDKFKTKTNFYMKKTESDIWYLQFYVNHKTGMMHSTTSSKKVAGVINSNKDTTMWTMEREGIPNFNEVDSYESQTGILQESAIIPNNSGLTCRYKTSVVANNRLYVGNIMQNGVIYGDRMIKSPINKYNILPSTNFIDVAINDGDEITGLAYYKDKLLQYKKRKVFVINMSADYEYLEDTFDNIGVQRQCQIVTTPMGIAWANSSGCFLYDGQKVMNLIDNKLGTEAFQSGINNNYWTISDSDIPVIGYIKSTKKIIVSKNAASHTINAVPTMWQFDFISQGWTFLFQKQKVQTNNTAFAPSNFINDENGDLLWYSNDGNAIYKWSDSPVTNTDSGANLDNFILITKDYDFGNPSVRKKIYKVYVTFKAVDDSNGSGSKTAAHSNIKVYFATNGDLSSDNWTEFSTNSKNYDTTNGLSDGASSVEWIQAELKPPSSINNVNSIALKFQGETTNIPNGFEINDFSIVYRIKRVK